jgi:tetratricopeptide (TPR) repeat protein
LIKRENKNTLLRLPDTNTQIQIQIEPRLASAFHNRALAYSRKKEYQKALDDLNKAQALGFRVDQTLLDEVRKAQAEAQRSLRLPMTSRRLNPTTSGAWKDWLRANIRKPSPSSTRR